MRKTATEHVAQLPMRYDSLRRVLDAVFGKERVPVYLNAYPDPLRRDLAAKESLCGFRDRPKTTNPANAWYAAHDLATQGVFGRAADSWQFNITARRDPSDHKYEADATWLVVEKLRTTMRSAAAKQQLQFVDAAGDVMVGHGFCVGERGDTTEDPQFHVPSVAPTWAPSSWDPYASRGRFVRTLNDAVLTQMRLNGRLPNGILHPTAESHAATADAVIAAFAAGVPHNAGGR